MNYKIGLLILLYVCMNVWKEGEEQDEAEEESSNRLRKEAMQQRSSGNTTPRRRRRQRQQIVSWPLRLVVKKKKGTCMVVHVKAIRCFSWRYKVSLLQVKELSTALFAFACGIAGCHCGLYLQLRGHCYALTTPPRRRRRLCHWGHGAAFRTTFAGKLFPRDISAWRNTPTPLGWFFHMQQKSEE